MKITFLPIVALTFSALLFAEAKKPAALPAAAAPDQPYDQLVGKRLREGIDSIASGPNMNDQKPNIGGGIYKPVWKMVTTDH